MRKTTWPSWERGPRAGLEPRWRGAQPPGPRRAVAGPGWGRAEGMARFLGLSEEQKAQVRKLMEGQRAEARGAAGEDRAEPRAAPAGARERQPRPAVGRRARHRGPPPARAGRALREAQDKAVRALLTPEQQAKFDAMKALREDGPGRTSGRRPRLRGPRRAPRLEPAARDRRAPGRGPGGPSRLSLTPRRRGRRASSCAGRAPASSRRRGRLLAECRRQLRRALAGPAPDSAVVLELTRAGAAAASERESELAAALERALAGLLRPEQAVRLRALPPTVLGDVLGRLSA